ncbi:TCF25 isoform 17, partial [Pan troglodytes]
MSRRALRRLRGEQRGQEPLGPGALQFDLRDDDDAEEEGPKRELGVRRPGGAGKEGVRVNNRFELINIDDLEDDPVVNGERSGCALTDAAAPGNKGRGQRGNTESKTDGDVTETAPSEQSHASGKLRKKKKKQKNKKSSTGEASENGLEDIDRILERIEDSTGLNRPGPAPLSSRKHVLYVEHRHLNPDTELKSEEYQQAQHKFLVAVESMEPNNIVLSDACRFQEDQEMARDLVERALYSMECAFHPLFSLTSGACRLDYRRPEN